MFDQTTGPSHHVLSTEPSAAKPFVGCLRLQRFYPLAIMCVNRVCFSCKCHGFCCIQNETRIK